MNIKKHIPTKQALSLASALRKRGIHLKTEYYDGHKTVDIFIPKARLYIEVDGLQHYTDPEQFVADLKRDHYSDDEKFFTKHISNQLVETYLEAISDAIAQIVEDRQVKFEK